MCVADIRARGPTPKGMDLAAASGRAAGPGERRLDDPLGLGAVLPAADISALARLQLFVDVEEVADLGGEMPRYVRQILRRRVARVPGRAR